MKLDWGANARRLTQNVRMHAPSLCLLGVLACMLCVAFYFAPPAREPIAVSPITPDMRGLVRAQDGRALIDINSADAELLCSLSGIGKTLAGRIIDFREENGPFQSIEDLMQVPGIGSGKLDAIRAQICVGG